MDGFEFQPLSPQREYAQFLEIMREVEAAAIKRLCIPPIQPEQVAAWSFSAEVISSAPAVRMFDRMLTNAS